MTLSDQGKRSILVTRVRTIASMADAVTGQLEKMEVSEKQQPVTKGGKKKGAEADAHPLEVRRHLARKVWSLSTLLFHCC